MNDLYKVNQVYYRMLPTLSLVAKRTLVVNYPQSTSYQGTTQPIIFNMNTGEFYTAMNTSWLYIQCGFKNAASYGTTKALIDQGNILSLLEEVIFTSASGTECERQVNKGLNSAVRFRWTHDQIYIDTIGQVQGAPYGPYSKIHDGASPVQVLRMNESGDGAADQTGSAWALYPELGGSDIVTRPWTGPAAQFLYGSRATNLNVYSTQAASDTGIPAPDGTGYSSLDYPEFVVPLDQILGIFKPYMNCLFPAGLLSGGRLELRWKRCAESIHFVGIPQIVAGQSDAKMNLLINDSDQAFFVKKTYLVFDAFQLQDNVLKRLNQTAAGPDGLSMLFDTYDQVSTLFNGTGVAEAQVSQARSRVVRSWNVVRDNANVTNPYLNSFASEAAARRMTGFVPAGMTRVDINSAAGVIYPRLVGSDGKSGTSIGGGLNYVTSLTTNEVGVQTFDSKNTSILPVIHAMPPDIYGTVALNNTWGRPMVDSYQAQLGALYFPLQPVTNNKEHYQNALYLWGQSIPDSRVNCSVTYEDFLGALGYNTYEMDGTTPAFATASRIDPTIPQTATLNDGKTTSPLWIEPWGLAVYGALMEKSQALQLSGLPLSNARLLRHKFNFPYPAISNQRRIDTFTEFTRVVKVFLGGRVVLRE